MSKCSVIIDTWQIQCCGERFKVGEKVKWCVEYFGKSLDSYPYIGSVDYYYENHPTKTNGYYTFTGIVASIEVLYVHLIPDPVDVKMLIALPDTYSKPVREAAVRVKNDNEHSFDGYIVHFDDYQIRPEDEDEIYPYTRTPVLNLDNIKEIIDKQFTDEIVVKMILESGNKLTRELIQQKFHVDVLRNHVGGDPFYYFDDDSYELLSIKIDVLTALYYGTSSLDIPQYRSIFELLPPDAQIDDYTR